MNTIFGGVFDAKGYKFTMFAVCFTFIAAGGLLLLAEVTKNIYLLSAAFLVIGLAYAGVVPTNSAYTSYFFGQQNYSLNFSIVNLNLIFASYLGPWCANGDYTTTFMIIIAFAIVGMGITFMIRRPAPEQTTADAPATEL